MNCLYCQAPLPAASRRDRKYCDNLCRAWAAYWRGRNGDPPPQPWRHEALTAEDPVLAAAAARAQQLAEARGWSRTTLRGVLDGLTTVLSGLPAGARVPMSEARSRPHKDVSRPRLAEVLGDLGLLRDDSTEAVRAWIERVAGELAPGFAGPARQWLLELLDGGPRAKPRSEATVYAYGGSARPLLQEWGRVYGHLREVTRSDVYAAIQPMSGYPRNKTVQALRSLFRFAKRRGLVFSDPAAGVKAAPIDPGMIPMTDDEIRAIESLAAFPAQRLAVALAAEHAARPGVIRHLKLDDIDLPNRRITLAGHDQRLGELTHRAMRAWLGHRRATWPHSPNPHVLISKRTTHGTGPVSHEFVRFSLGANGFSVDRIRADRILHEALTAAPDPLHLSLVFNLNHSTAMRYATVAEHLLSDELEQPPDPQGERE
jgi:integrase